MYIGSVFSGPCFPVFGLNLDIYSAFSFQIQENRDQTKAPNSDTFHTVCSVSVNNETSIRNCHFMVCNGRKGKKR